MSPDEELVTLEKGTEGILWTEIAPPPGPREHPQKVIFGPI